MFRESKLTLIAVGLLSLSSPLAYAEAMRFDIREKIASPDTSVQYNVNGAFSGDTVFTYSRDLALLSVDALSTRSITSDTGHITLGGIDSSDCGSGDDSFGCGSLRISFDSLNTITISSDSGHNILSLDRMNFMATAQGEILASDGTQMVVVPSAAAGRVLSTDPTQPSGLFWATPATGGGSPAGGDEQVQFYDGGIFGGDPTFTFNKDVNNLTVDSIDIQGTFVIGGISADLSYTGVLTVSGEATVLDAFWVSPEQATYSSTVTLNAYSGNYFEVILTGRTDFAAPSGGHHGQKIIVMFSQDATGNREVGFLEGIQFSSSDVTSPDIAGDYGGPGVKTYLGLIHGGTSWDVLSVSGGYR